MANNIVVNDEGESSDQHMNTPEDRLVSWVLSTIQPWIEYRDSNFKDKWDEYYRLWRGIHIEQDKTRKSERSKLIVPALQQAIESAVSEQEEAIFGKGRWFDLDDDLMDQNPQDISAYRNLLLEDLDNSDVRDSLSEVFLNGAIYGTGIGKIVVSEVDTRRVDQADIGGGVTEGVANVDQQVEVRLVPIAPDEFAIDPSARTIDEALGCAHITIVPKHGIIKKQQDGIYLDGDIGSFTDDLDLNPKGESKSPLALDSTKIIEYHGLVPSHLLPQTLAEDDEEFVDLFEDTDYEADTVDFVEAIVTIANDDVLLKAVQNPHMMEDRSFIAYQHDTVPNRFWGRGVAEKGYNPQKALDAELRARIDAMALTVHPMMGVDATRIPRGGSFSVEPGKNVYTNGDPNTVLRPFNFGEVNPNTFHQSGDLERMVQMATGSMDSASPVSVNARNNTASGMSMMLSGSIKRSKRTLANIERKFISPLLHKTAWRYMQLDPDRYPVMDIKFKVYSTLGIMAREVEQQQLTSLLNTVPPDSPAYWMLIRSIYENSSITDKDKMLVVIDQMLQQALQPKQDPMAQIKAQEVQMKAQKDQASLEIELMRAKTEMARVMVEQEKVGDQRVKLETEAILNLAKAEAEEVGSQLDAYRAEVDAMQAQSTSEVEVGRGNTENQGS